MTLSDKGLLSVDEAAQYLGISRSKLWVLVSSGEIPSIKIGRSRRVSTDRLRTWIADHESPPVAA